MVVRFWRLPTGHKTLLPRWINVNDADSTSHQRHVPGGDKVDPLTERVKFPWVISKYKNVDVHFIWDVKM